ncbi:amino acid ABC transporter permease [Stieleria sp. TO1_6]|uniref:ABC transporter permease n=1 Tax=Stieleria tagensis TaxID=2956795 RepID=UPI00209B9464|nr:amino acid ABC transporter permease [Stieleria tagensis]MCO8121018.1 amino acid ABC transporter permease [Stieleria tagensis]
MIWIQPLLLTLQLMLLCVVVAALIGIPLAFLISLLPQQRRGGRVIAGYCLLSMVACVATPMILHAAAWEATAGKFGWLTFSQTAARTYTGLAGRYGGLVACVWIHGLFGASLVSLATWFGTARISNDVVDQSRLDGGPIRAWWWVRLPLAWPWVCTGLLATAILAATEMTVVDLYGVRTLADEFYLFHVTQPSLVSVMMVLVLPCALLIALAAVGILHRRRPVDARRLRPIDPAVVPESPRGWGWFAAPPAVALSTLMFAFPFAGLLMKTGQTVIVSPQPDQGATVHWSLRHCVEVLAVAPREYADEYRWTLLLAVAVGLVCVPVAWTLASLMRTRPQAGRWVDWISLVVFLIPGPIVGLVVVWLFSLPLPGFKLLYQQSLLPTILALMMRALPVSYWIIRAAYWGLDRSLLDVARLDLSWGRRMWSIDRVLLIRPLLVAGLASAVMASGDVPVTLPVLPPGVVTVGTRLFALLHSGARNQEAALAFWYVLAIIFVSIVLWIGWKRSGR